MVYTMLLQMASEVLLLYPLPRTRHIFCSCIFRKTVVTGFVCGCGESWYKGENSGSLPEIGEHWLEKFLHILIVK